MTPSHGNDNEQFDDEQDAGSRRGGPPELGRRQSNTSQVRKTARRNRSNDVAKRGMHQRRNKRMAW